MMTTGLVPRQNFVSETVNQNHNENNSIELSASTIGIYEAIFPLMWHSMLWSNIGVAQIILYNYDS